MCKISWIVHGALDAMFALCHDQQQFGGDSCEHGKNLLPYEPSVVYAALWQCPILIGDDLQSTPEKYAEELQWTTRTSKMLTLQRRESSRQRSAQGFTHRFYE